MALPDLRPGQHWIRRDGTTVLVGPSGLTSRNTFYAEGAYYELTPQGDCYPAISGIKGLDLVEMAATAPVPLKRTFDSISTTHDGNYELAVASDGTAWRRYVGQSVFGEWQQITNLPQP
jgi:hypothetical protein